MTFAAKGRLTVLTEVTTFVTMMVMKKNARMPAAGRIRVSVAQAKSQLSSLLRNVEREPVVIHNRGRDVACLTSAESAATSQVEATPFVTFFNRLEAIRKRVGLAGVTFAPVPAIIRPVDPFEH